MRNEIFTIREAFRCLRILIKFYLMVVLLEVVVRDQVPVELEIQHIVLALNVPGHSQMLNVAALLLLVPGVGDLPLVAAMI